MKVPYDIQFLDPPKNWDARWFQTFFQDIAEKLGYQAQILNGSLGFGNGTDVENVRGAWVTYTSNAVANTEDTVPHGLAVVPIGFIVIRRDKAGVVYDGGTSWTNSNLYLKCSTASTVITMFVLTAPEASS